MSDPTAFQEKLKQLNALYAAQLPDKVSAIQQDWRKFLLNTQPSAELEVLHRNVHSLAGSGKTFGFPVVSDVARKLERFLKDKIALNSLFDEQDQTIVDQALCELAQVSLSTEFEQIEHYLALSPHISPHRQYQHICIVDADLTLTDMLQLELGYFGYQVFVFNDLMSFQRHQDDLLNTVLIMGEGFAEGDVAGIELVTQLQEKFNHELAVIFMGDHHEMTHRLAAVRAGGRAYSRKPINFSDLLDKLDLFFNPEESKKYRVLLIDDSEILANYYATVLQQENIEVMVLNDPMLVLRALYDFHPDLILIDVYMPGCNGLELAQIIHQLDDFIGIPVVFLSVERDVNKQLLALDQGGDDFLTKPIHAEHLIAVVLSRIKRAQKMRALMHSDSMTSLLNHSTFKVQLEREIARAERQEDSLCLAMIDLDYFKKVNDKYGHLSGDRVIKSLARLLKQRLRGNDLIARYGGEEFVVALPSGQINQIAQVLDEIRYDFSLLKHTDGHIEFVSTFSCGVVELSPGCSVDQLIEAADQALYRAKHEGRNRVVVGVGF